jgi:hypothetical protein
MCETITPKKRTPRRRLPSGAACGVASFFLLLLACFCALTGARVAVGGDTGTLRATQLTTIYAVKQDAPAAYDLAAYLKKITQQECKVLLSETPPGEAPNAFIIGPYQEVDVKGLPGDSFIVKVEPEKNTVRIYGTNPRATRQGVFDFLEKEAGCRWYTYNEEDVPKTPDLTFAGQTRTVKAPFWQTDIRNNEAYDEKSAFNYKIKSISTDEQTKSHAMYSQLESYGKNHPEIYPFIKKLGKRDANKVHHCYSAPNLAQALAAAIEEDMKKWPDLKHTIYMSCMGDAYGGYCECPTCTAIYQEEAWTRPDGTKSPGYSATLLRLINQTAEILEKKYPGIRVGTSAYMSLEAPPAVTVPRANVYIRIPHLRHCIIHGVEECQKNKRYFENLKRWGELAPGRIYLWDYTVNFGENFLFPLPDIRAIADNIKLYHKLGVAGMTLQGNYVSTGSDLVALKNYVYAKLLWDPSLNTDALIAEFCKNYYGPAADSMVDYVNVLESFPRENLKLHADEFAEPPVIRTNYLPAEQVGKLQAAMDKAIAASRQKPPYDRRVDEAAVSLTAWALFAERPFVQTPQGLAKNAGEKTVYTYDRAVEMIKNSRNASFREWGGPLKYQPHFLAAQGGPLATLTSPVLSAQLAPALGMRLWQVTYKGKPVFHVADSTEEEGFPQVGGAYEATSPGVIHATLATDPKPTPQSVTASGFHTSNTTEMASVVKTVAVTGDNTLTVTLSSKATKRKPNFAGAGGTACLEFDFDRKNMPMVLVDDGSGFQPFTLPKVPGNNPKAKPKKELPVEHLLGEKIIAIRIGLPDKGCWVEDRIDVASAKAGPAYVSFDPRSGVMKTKLTIPRSAINDESLTQWLTRTLQFTDYAAR